MVSYFRQVFEVEELGGLYEQLEEVISRPKDRV
jgi:hypothetical protein